MTWGNFKQDTEVFAIFKLYDVLDNEVVIQYLTKGIGVHNQYRFSSFYEIL